MEVNSAINKLKDHILTKYEETKHKVGTNVIRGHLRTLSTEIEDGVALFLLDILPEGYKALVDCSVHIDGKSHRPDILIIDSENKVKFLVEVKTNMGWCRNATNELNKILQKHNKMASVGNIRCMFSNDPEINVFYSDEVKIFLIPFKKGNCSEDKHTNNMELAKEKGISYFRLFDNWYSNLENKEIEKFANTIIKGV